MGAIPLDRTPTWEAIIESAKLGCGFLMHGKGRFSLVDEELMEGLEVFNWGYDDRGYIKRQAGFNPRRLIYLHREVVGAPKELDVDHWNLVKRDNRRLNLRLCTPSQNNANSVKRSHNKASKYKGVRRSHGGSAWCARGIHNKNEKHLGSFKTEEEAALAYNKWATETFGEFAKLNIIP